MTRFSVGAAEDMDDDETAASSSSCQPGQRKRRRRRRLMRVSNDDFASSLGDDEQQQDPLLPSNSNGGGEGGIWPESDHHDVDEIEKEERCSSMTIDFDLLDCSICLEPLCPPIFQCDIGHTACSSCCSKLVGKCHLCSQPIGDKRCFSMEKIVESVKVSCRNAPFGCPSMIPYASRPSHEAKCTYAPCKCPIDGCRFTGSSEKIMSHLINVHSVLTQRFRYGRSFNITLKKNEESSILNASDGLLFFLYNKMHALGNIVVVVCISRSCPSSGFVYKLRATNGEKSLTLRSFAKKINRQLVFDVCDFLLIPEGFVDGEVLRLEVVMKDSRQDT